MRKRKILIAVICAAIAIVATVALLNFLPSDSHSKSSGNSTNDDHEPPPSGSNWISPGKVFVSNYIVGHPVTYEISIHNGGDSTAEFSIDYRYPDGLTEGYSKPPTDVPIWLYMHSGDLKGRRLFVPVEAGATRVISITLSVPESAELEADKWEFWIGVIDKSQTGMVITELATRVLVTMK